MDASSTRQRALRAAPLSPLPTSVPVDELPWLGDLRREERQRAASRFRHGALEAGERHAHGVDEPPRMGLVVAGEITLTAAPPGLGPVTLRLGPGDRWDEPMLFAGIPTAIELRAETPAEIALLDETGFHALAEEFPIVWLEVAARLSQELKWRNDLLREIQEFEATRMDAASLEVFLAARRRRVARRASVTRTATRALLQRLLTEPGREPAFWILTGFIVAIAVSRAVVAVILAFGLEQQLFNIRDVGAANPIHTHHFHYGFAVLITAGLLAFFPRFRRWLRVLAAAFGVGLGLVFDEFALIWNLNPDYYHRVSYQAQAVLVALLIQVVYFRRAYAALFARALRRLRPG